MKKLAIALAAFASLAVAAPTLASADDVTIGIGGIHRDHDGMRDRDGIGGMHRDRDHDGMRDRDGMRGVRNEMHEDRGWHRGWRHHDDRIVVIKRRHRHDD